MDAKIIKRWNERVVPNGWDKLGAEGAKKYLEKYGKNIGMDKLLAFSEYARSLGLNAFADEMTGKVELWKVVDVSEAQEWANGDIVDMYEGDYGEVGKGNLSIVETTIGELGKKSIGTACGGEGNEAYKTIATKFPNHRVRCCIERSPETGKMITGSVEIFIKGQREGSQIESLASDGNGSLRCDYSGEGACWTYFETE